MTTDEAAKATRRNGDELDEAIREAVRGELAERGYAGLTFEGVARRARTGKPVIYRRYSSRAQMVVDAWVRHTVADLPRASTGSLRGDLLAVGAAFVQRFELIGLDTLRGLIAEVGDDLLPQLAEMTSAAANEILGAVIDAARERGEIPPGELPPRVVSLPLALMRHELLFAGRVDEATMADLVDTLCLPLLTAGREDDAVSRT
ncbi:TetR/AcrR family transcriptional regulator [Cellulomonas cellasea]|uniref:TetR/AcrR family transcriptional regulator n=1 Tax=Cellulomonas cellasea TaxID=43670 RepID=UPI0025A4B370|nr:TetR/AcrR family transcriptional regulator [Cellulomonas cellasea]MDM8084477.1 TetR/AcrR family transcriptional regulator [Cellulomonas cellasea]